MSYDAKKSEFSRLPCTVVELDFEFCQLTHSVAPCTATGTGDARCFNTFASCQDKPNFTPDIKTYRFVDVEGVPVGLDAIPCVQNVSISPSQIDLEGGLGVRAQAVVTMRDVPSSDIDEDPYLSGRTYIAFERGTFWTKFRARNPFYVGRAARILYGYLNEDGSFDAANFQARHYVIDKIDVSNGQAVITMKDPLVKALDKRAKAPLASSGELDSNLTDTTTTFVVTDASEYAPGSVIRIRSEVMRVTGRSANVLTVQRGQFNTAATEHTIGDTVQLCLEYDAERVDDILTDLLVNYAGLDPAFIPSTRWEEEIDAFLPGLLSTLITEPTGVSQLLTELGEQAPHSLYWDEREQAIELKAVQPPPVDAEPLNDDANFLQDSVKVSDRPDLRASTIQVYFGQFDPTQKLDETRNYRQVYARFDADSVAAYGSNVTRVIFSRWITNVNKAAAVVLAQRLGRRFADIPREVRFSMDAKDSDNWAGDTVSIRHREIVDFTGAEQARPFQITSVQPSGESYNYTGIEYTFGRELPDDQPDDENVIRIGADVNNINIRAIYDTLFPAPDTDTVVRLIVEQGVVVGSSSTSTFALETGSWPSGMDPIKLDIRGRVVGRGGAGGSVGVNGGAGGPALRLGYDAELLSTGTIGGGGGGGGHTTFVDGATSGEIPGSGGAGRIGGTSGGGIFITGEDVITFIQNPADGSLLEGGAIGQVAYETAGEPNFQSGVSGGGLGQAGANSTTSGGAAGVAIDRNGFTLTQTLPGIISGAIVG